jgi:hypothetical protein
VYSSVENRVRWGTLVNTVINLSVQYKAENFLAS